MDSSGGMSIYKLCWYAKPGLTFDGWLAEARSPKIMCI